MTKNILSELGLGIDSPLAIPDAPNYRPPCWPPQRDWPVIIDAAGQVVSRWGDAIWRLDPWAENGSLSISAMAQLRNMSPRSILRTPIYCGP
ncbi:hypothetical protein [Klebsiella quasipneumoniae]|uniref:hypothetical protein n=1 Tax=Klebsiella quasipneumoniae TaxID=1463165 RepID=UPI00296E3A8C|nr:hypothetical protein [Klebsiella quasipneumoniae]MDW3821666.1 hypothetical protein [Klebsiella quasipneumoniae]MDW3821805.1 hypothetical protein [Klebsiella quasipneumoniae]